MLRSPIALLVAAALAFLATAIFSLPAVAQTPMPELAANGFRIGERLTYSVSIGRLSGAAFAELHTVSRGRLGDKDAIELRAKFKTLDLASATFYLIDESRTTFVSPSTSLPLHTTITSNAFGLPKETNQSFVAVPTPHADLVSMIYRIRQMGGTGSLTLHENERIYSVTFQAGAVEKQKTDAGEFETSVVSVESEYFTERGITNVRFNLSTDETKLPVLIRFRTSKGTVRAALASVQMTEPEPAVQSTPTPAGTPLPERTPKPVATPLPYVDNLPLAPELAFELGERLEYKILSNGQPVAKMRLSVKERKQFNNGDNLVLEAVFSETRAGSPFASGDLVRAYVHPETLAPAQIELKFAGALRPYNATIKYEQQGSSIVFGGANPVDAPVGTHSILSLLYAARSFNLKPSRDLNNPINDTRVAVFWESEPYIFTLRPSASEVITLDGKPAAAQLVTVTTKNSLLDQLNIRIWLGNDDARIPLRFIAGQYQADLVSVSKVLPN